MNFPLILTVARLLAPLLICPLIFVTGPWLNLATWAAALIFTLAAISDWADGFLARRYALNSDWGRILDPIADKALTILTLFALAAAQRLELLALIVSLLLIFREVGVAALREGLATEGRAPNVTALSKIKTLCFFIALGLLILGGACAPWGLGMLMLTAILAYMSGYLYLREAIEG